MDRHYLRSIRHVLCWKKNNGPTNRGLIRSSGPIVVLVCFAFLIQPMLVKANGETSPEAMLQRGKKYIDAGDYAQAVDILRAAQSAKPKDASMALWLARACGHLAERSNWFTAMEFAKETHKYLELAVELAPNDLDALTDLQEYYERAPGFLGGSTEKAEQIKRRIALLKEH